jgi:hypothetical protein
MVVAAPAPELPVGARTASTVHPAQPVPRHWSTAGTLGLLAIAVITNLALLAALTATNHQTTAPQVSPAHPSPTPPVAKLQAAPPAAATTFGEGKFVVGTDIAPGTYRTSGPAGKLDCYWERLKDTRSDTDSIIANSLGRAPATVTIDRTDAAFQTRWCSPWVKIG